MPATSCTESCASTVFDDCWMAGRTRTSHQSPLLLSCVHLPDRIQRRLTKGLQEDTFAESSTAQVDPWCRHRVAHECGWLRQYCCSMPKCIFQCACADLEHRMLILRLSKARTAPFEVHVCWHHVLPREMMIGRFQRHSFRQERSAVQVRQHAIGSVIQGQPAAGAPQISLGVTFLWSPGSANCCLDHAWLLFDAGCTTSIRWTMPQSSFFKGHPLLFTGRKPLHQVGYHCRSYWGA